MKVIKQPTPQPAAARYPAAEFARLPGLPKRPAKKFVCDLEVVLEEPGRSSITGRMHDLSGSGISVVADRPVALRTEVNLGLRLLLDWAESDTLQLSGRVMWCTPVGDNFQIGVLFNQMPVSRWQNLDVLLRFLRGELALDGSNLSSPSGRRR